MKNVLWKGRYILYISRASISVNRNASLGDIEDELHNGDIKGRPVTGSMSIDPLLLGTKTHHEAS